MLHLSFQVLKPELIVGILEVSALVTVVAVHAVRIDHEVELLSGFVHGIKKLESILMMLTMSREF